MINQLDDHSCGVVATANALRAVGHYVETRDVRPHTGTTTAEGTGEHGVMQAVERLGHQFEVLELPWRKAYPRLRAHLEGGGSAILNTEAGDHWTTAVGVSGERTLVYDAQPSARSRGESGLKSMSREQLRRHWASGRNRYAVLVHPR